MPVVSWKKKRRRSTSRWKRSQGECYGPGMSNTWCYFCDGIFFLKIIHRDPCALHFPCDLQEEMQIAIEEQHGANPLYTYANVSCGGATTADFDFQMDYLPKVGWVDGGHSRSVAWKTISCLMIIIRIVLDLHNEVGKSTRNWNFMRHLCAQTDHGKRFSDSTRTALPSALWNLSPWKDCSSG